MNAPQITTTPPAAAGAKGKGNSKGAAKGPAKPKKYIVIGAEGVAQVEALCASIEASLGFRPTQAQIVVRLVKLATEKAAAEAAQKSAGATSEPAQG